MDTRPSPPPASTRQKTPGSPSLPSQLTSGSSMASSSSNPGASAKNGRSGSVSRPGTAKGPEDDKACQPANKDVLKQKSSRKMDDTARANKNEELLKSMKNDFDSLRSLVTCKICDRLLYEPYIISCGHTYCYSCLCTWFVNNKAKKTCPDCRSVVVEKPAPAYLIREMTLLFINRAELLPQGETMEQHAKWQKEEADIVQQDKNNKDPRTGGLFKGSFQPRSHARAIHDVEDNVDRCPMCGWELEEGQCSRCNIVFDEDGYPIDGFGNFSDMDEMSEHDMSSEDLDGELEMEDDEFAMGWDGEWGDQFMDDEAGYAVRRWLAHGGGPPAPYPFARRRAAHSAAGSRRRAYPVSLMSDGATVSDVLTEETEMDTLEEEDEDELDEDSLMDDFVVNDEESERASERSSSTPSQTPQPSSNSRTQRLRRVVESEASSVASRTTDEDDEEEGPVTNSRRRQQLRARALLSRANGSSNRTASSTSTDLSNSNELDEDTQNLLQEAGWSPLGHDGPDDGMEEDYESDGGRTTVGWEPIANSNDRSRTTRSLTAAADRLNVHIRPPSRAGGSRIVDGSRGLRRRSSVVSTVPAANYGDGDADDDDSEIDRDGNTSMNGGPLRPRRSIIRLRGATATPNNRSVFRGAAVDPVDADTDENSDDTSIQSPRRRQVRRARQEYDPRISWMFAQHQTDILELSRQGAHVDLLEQLRSTTPIARPPTTNRNRRTPLSSLASPFSPPFHAASPGPNLAGQPRLRTPFQDSGNPGFRQANAPISERPPTLNGQAGGSTHDNVSQNQVSSPGRIVNRALSEQLGGSSQIAGPSQADLIDRPISRVSNRPPSAAGRRSSLGYGNGVQSPLMSPGVGLNFAARTLAQTQPRNPWNNPFMGHLVRPRPSSQHLREQPSNQTIRPRTSQRLRNQPSNQTIRDVPVSNQSMRAQASRNNLRSAPSHQRLRSQPSARALHPMQQGGQSRAGVATGGYQLQSSPRTSAAGRSRLASDELNRRANELIQHRTQQLLTNPPPTRTNPFTSGSRAPAPQSGDSAMRAAANSNATATQNTRTSGEASPDGELTDTVRSVPTQPASSSPHLGGRQLRPSRSIRNIGATTGALAPPQAPYVPAQNPYSNGQLRTRSGSGGNSFGIESSLGSPLSTGLSPMVAAGDRGSF